MSKLKSYDVVVVLLGKWLSEEETKVAIGLEGETIYVHETTHVHGQDQTDEEVAAFVAKSHPTWQVLDILR